jgi:mannan endo-1,4-beta-mannosidase
MGARGRTLRWSLAALVPAALVVQLGLAATPATAVEGVQSFDFEAGIEGWTAPDWLEANAGPAAHSTDQAVSGTHSLAVAVSYPAATGWSQTGANYRLPEPFSATGTASFQVYAPVAGLSARFQFNDPWTEPTGLRPLAVGWNTVTYDIGADFAAPVGRVNEILLFVVAQNLPEAFTGTVYFDDVSFTAGLPVDPEPEPPSGGISFDFEDGVAGWTAPTWLESNAGNPVQDTTQVRSGASSMAVPVLYEAGSGWEQSGAVYRFPNAPVDISGFVAATFHVYAPVAGLSARFQFNDPWTEPATGLRPLDVGWNQITYDISPASEDFPGGMASANEIILFVVGQNLTETYAGNVWFDDMSFVAAAQPIVFDFEDGVGGWFAPEWLSANDLTQPITQDDAFAASGTYSLALPVRFPAGSGFEQAGAVYRFPDAPVDLLGFEKVTFFVYAPVTGLSADFIFNDPWNPPAALRPLELGWNELTFDITPASEDWPGGVSRANEFIIRVVAQNLTATYEAPVWIDNIQFLPGTAPLLRIEAPADNDTLAVPLGETYPIEVEAGAFGARQLESVTWASDTQQGTLTQDPATGTWTGDWDIWAEGEGVSGLAVTATDDEGESSTARVVVLVRNSGITVDITSPAFDAELAGQVDVVATVTPDERFALEEVVLYSLENDIDPVTMDLVDTGDGTVSATASLDTEQLADGVDSLAVEARDAHFTVRELAHVVVRNTPQDWDFVDTSGTRFVHKGETFRYIGFNEYELFTAPPNFGRGTVANLDETILGEVLLPGTELDWQQLIDRQLLEAARNGQTVLRTWAFNRNNEDSAFQRMVDGEIVFQESTFQRLDYVLDSARRHNIRVILTLDNYWPDYGGIGRAAQWLGLDNKLQFFTDPAGIAFYQQYAEHLVTRVNTVNGTPYAQDPTVFAWELMNEPRMDCAADPTPDHQFCDPTGQVMRSWMAQQASFIKSLAPHQMVSPGGEAHAWTPTPSGGLQYGSAEEGNNNIPFFDMDIPEVDFFTFHPYPNAWWARLTKEQTRELVVSLTRMGAERGKPVVMEEYGIDRTQTVFNDAGEELETSTPEYAAERVEHYRMMLDACYTNGCAGSNVWMLADWSDRALNVNLYKPGPDAQRDRELVGIFDAYADRLADDDAPVTPATCDVRYRVVLKLGGYFLAEVRVTNRTDSTVDGWELGFWFEGGQRVEEALGAAATQEAALVTATNASFNGTLRPGRSASFLLLGSASGANPAPKVFSLNGHICS